jgi:hypothetical protein
VKLRRTTSLAALAALALMGALVTPGSPATGSTAQAPSARASVGTLSVSPTRFVSGQALTWSGRLPVSGIRTITMQRFLNRPGDSWIDVKNFKAKTKSDGSFSFQYAAPDMINIGFRVKSGKYATSKLDLYPRMQDVVLTLPHPAVAGLPFTIVADTTNTDAPVIAGRVLTLQQRVDPTTWKFVSATVVGPDGKGTFAVLEPSVGQKVYRVREEDWTEGANRIGWYPSFPMYVDVAPSLAKARSQTSSTARQVTSPTATRTTTSASRTSTRRTAAQRWRWGYPIFDFDWTSGQSLSSPPGRGSLRQGQWSEYSDGTGRAAKRSGQLGLWSGRYDRYSSGNRGTTYATITGNAQSYGRWETKLKTVTKTAGPHYLVRVELVPENPADYDCGAHNITVAEVQDGQTTALVGARKGTAQWTRNVDLSNIASTPANVAIELMTRHVTWFVDSSPVATLKVRRIAGNVPMTLRLSLVGSGDQEMASTVLLSDWQRAFPINRSPGVTSGAALTRSSYAPTCG